MDIEKDFKKFRWFFTSSGNLVIGGKSEEQNEELVTSMIQARHERIVMHTSSPGSPFSFIIKEFDKVNEKDLEETAVFTACFSKAWKLSKGKIEVDVFRISQIFKDKKMKAGTFGVVGSVKRKVMPRLYILKQENVVRAVPFKPQEEKIISLVPGSLSKEKAAEKIAELLKAEKEEVMQAIPAGGFTVE